MGYYDTFSGKIDAFRIKQAEHSELPVTIESYKDALDWWQRKEPWKGSNDRPVGKRDCSYRRMRMNNQGSIAFEYSGNVYATWHRDDTLTISPNTGYAYGAFTNHVAPLGVDSAYNTNLGRYVLLSADNATKTKIEIQGMHGIEHVTNPDIKVIRAPNPVILKRQVDEDSGDTMWLPENIWKVSPFEWFELNKSQLREASLKYNINDFVCAIEAALAMGAEIKTAGTHSSRWSKATNNKTTASESILELLEQERFVEAAQMVRVNQSSTYDPVARKYTYNTTGLKAGDIKSIRQLAYKELGLYYIESQRIVTLPMLTNIETKLRDLGKPS